MNKTKMIQMTKEARQSVRDSRAKQYREAHAGIAIVRKHNPEFANATRVDLRGAIKQTQRNFPKHGLTGKRHRVFAAYPSSPTAPTVKCCNCGVAFPDERIAEASVCEERRI